MTSVLIASDWPIWLDGLCALLRERAVCAHIERASLGSADANSMRVADAGPAVVAADECSGAALDALTRLQRQGSRVVLVAPTRTLPLFAEVSQPDAVVSAQGSTEELLEALRAVERGETYLPASWGARNRSSKALTAKENELLAHLARGAPLGQAAKLMGMSYKSADYYRTRLFQKYEVSNRVELVLRAMRDGIVGA